MPRFVFLWTDAVIWALFFVIVFGVFCALKHPTWRAKWANLGKNKTAIFCAGILSVFFVVALTDSLHFRPKLTATESFAEAYSPKTVSALDALLLPHIAGTERSYSAPFALHDFDKTTVVRDGTPERIFARLKGASPNVAESEKEAALLKDTAKGIGYGLGLVALTLFILSALFGLQKKSLLLGVKSVLSQGNKMRPFIFVWLIFFFLVGVLASLWPAWHIFGTDAVGNDVLYSAVKSIRTAVVIGSLATFCTVPLAIVFGISAGFFKGKVDDVIQYIYTTITSVPSVLLIAASVLMIQVYIDKNPSLYETGLERADLRLFFLSVIIGLTGWAGLARLLRAETMKLTEVDFITAARAFAVSPLRIMTRHIFPNVAHIVLIVAVLDFSGIVLYEAVLSYVGVGVDPTMHSFGSLINLAASEMSRTPSVWWNLLASFLFMVTLVLAANLFASGVREIFDPHTSSRNSDA